MIIGDPRGKTLSVEILAKLIPIAKVRCAAKRGREGGGVLKRGIGQTGSYTVDTPVPYLISGLMSMLGEQMGRLANRGDVTTYCQVGTRIVSISGDPRYAFMLGSLMVQDLMAQIVGRLFCVPVKNKRNAILEPTGAPSEIVNVVVSVILPNGLRLCLVGQWRCSGDAGLRGNAPLRAEQSGSWLRADTARDRADCQRGAQIRYISVCCVTTPSDLDSTILSQCNTVFSMRMSNDRDQNFVRTAVFDTATSVLDFLPSMGPRSHRVRRRRDTSGPYPFRRSSRTRHAAQLHGQLYRQLPTGIRFGHRSGQSDRALARDRLAQIVHRCPGARVGTTCARRRHADPPRTGAARTAATLPAAIGAGASKSSDAVGTDRAERRTIQPIDRVRQASVNSTDTGNDPCAIAGGTKTSP